MARRNTKPLSAIVSQTRKLLQKKALAHGMVYCSYKKCGWGWELREGPLCPNCSSLPDGEGIKCENPDCGFSRKDGVVCPKCGQDNKGAQKSAAEEPV